MSLRRDWAGVSVPGVIGLSAMDGAAIQFGETYRDKVLSYGPIAYWMLAETAGIVAIDQVNSPAQDGTHTGVTLGQPGIGDGQTSPLYDGANDFTNIHTATFAGAFNGAAGTAVIWARVSGVGVWADGQVREALHIRVDFNNQVKLDKSAANVSWTYKAGGVTQNRIKAGVVTTDWMCLGLTWDAGADEVKPYYNGVQEGLTLNGLGVWAGAPINVWTNIGAQTTAPAVVWDGYLAHGAVWDVVLDAPSMLDLATI